MQTLEADVQKTRGFIQELEKAEEIYRRLLGLTRNQGEVLQSGVSEELLALARAKEEELLRLTQVEARMGSARSAWNELRDRVSSELRDEVQAVVNRVEAVLRELIQIEEEEGRWIAAKREETISQIHRLDSARKFRGAYLGNAPPPTLLDQKE